MRHHGRLVIGGDSPASVAATDAWELRRSPKYSTHGTVRVIPPEQTIARVTPLLETIGVTRVAEVTGLDRVGIPNFTTVRPRERGDGISYYNGKGVTHSAAHAGALMEAVERYSGELCDLPVRFARRSEIEGPTVDPTEIIVPLAEDFQPDGPLEWVEGFDLLSRRPTYVPLAAVVCPYEPPPGRPMAFYGSTNGLASGNTAEEAACHALCEVIERDAAAVADAILDLGPAVGALLSDAGLAAAPGPSLPTCESRFPLIDLDTLPPSALALVRQLRDAGLLVYLRDVTSTAGVATLDCSIVEIQAGGRYLAHGGSGTHPDARVAVTRALTEAAQSRVGHIQGGREDLLHIVTEPGPYDPEVVYGRGEIRPFSSIESFEHACIDDDIRFLLAGLEADGFEQVVVVDLTRPEVGIPVVRVVVPRAEAWSVYFSHARRSTFGPRVRRILAGACGAP